MIFAGVTVAISVTGLALIGIDFITKLGIGSALGVLTAVLLANSLLPAVLALLGHRIDRGRLGMKPSDESREGRLRTPVARWGRFVIRNAKFVLPVVLVVLLSPGVAGAEGAAGPGRRRHRARRARPSATAYDLLSGPGGFGPGFTSPIPVVVDLQLRPPGGRADPAGAWSRCPAIAQVEKPIYNAKTPDQATVAIVNAYSKYSPQDVKTDDIVSTLRDTTIPQTLQGSARTAYVSGQNAAFTDIGDKILGNAPWFLLYVIGVTFLVLAMAFRSVVIALKAALTTLLSALVGLRHADVDRAAGPRHGLRRPRPHRPDRELRAADHLRHPVRPVDRLRGVPDEPHPRGAHARSQDTLDAVREGVAGVGRVIVAASLIMSTVFFAFLLNPDRVSKEFALLLGIAILTDALLIRLTLVPALLTLLGEHSWYMPRWLDKILPNLTIEPPAEREVGRRRRRRRSRWERADGRLVSPSSTRPPAPPSGDAGAHLVAAHAAAAVVGDAPGGAAGDRVQPGRVADAEPGQRHGDVAVPVAGAGQRLVHRGHLTGEAHRQRRPPRHQLGQVLRRRAAAGRQLQHRQQCHRGHASDQPSRPDLRILPASLPCECRRHFVTRTSVP